MIAKKYVRHGLAVALVIALAVITIACSSKSSTLPSSTETPAVAVKLVFTTQPVGAGAGTSFVTSPVVAAVDADGNVVTGARALVTLAVTSDTGSKPPSLYGGTTMQLENGICNFKGLSMRKAGTYTLTAAGAGLSSAVSGPFEITPGEGASMYFSNTIIGSKAGSPFVAGPQLTILDNFGNLATTSTAEVSLTLIPDPYNLKEGGTLSGVKTARPVNGIVAFEGLSIEVAGSFILEASSRSMPTVYSAYFDIFPAEPASLFFSTQPKAAVAAGSPLTVNPPAIAVAVKDIYGNTVRDAAVEITITITPGTGAPGAVLSGVKSLPTGYGVSGFEGLTIDKVGTGYTLTATSDGLVSAVSDPFDITPPAPDTTSETTTTIP